MGRKYYKSYYLELSDDGVRKSVASALSSIGDFESLTYEHGPQKTVSRLKLLVSPTCHPPGNGKGFCFHKISQDNFEVIDDNGHLGCGFIHPEYLFELLGKSAAASRVFAIQVRIFGPATVGIAKGMLFVKKDIGKSKIQIPTSMVKVDKSSSTPVHTYVALSINQCFPSTNQLSIGRLFSDDPKINPTLSMVKALKPISPDVERVLRCKGASRDDIEQCKSSFVPRPNFTTESKYLSQLGDDLVRQNCIHAVE